MFQEATPTISAAVVEALQTEKAEQAITAIVAAKNAGIAALVAFAVLYGTAYQRVGSDFEFFPWLYANRNRWVNGIITLVLFSMISLLVPDVSALSNTIGFNLNAQVPLSFGLALAAWLALTTRAKKPTEADGAIQNNDDIDDEKINKGE